MMTRRYWSSRITPGPDEKSKILHDWQSGHWHAQLADRAMCCAQERPSPDSLYLALKIQHGLRGADADTLAVIGQLMERSACRTPWSKLSLRLLVSHLQLGDTMAAHDIVQRCMSHKVNLLQARRVRRFPMALTFLADHYHDRLNGQLHRQAQLARSLLHGQQQVDENLLLALHDRQSPQTTKPLTVAVVGNAPTLLETRQGQHIDQHDIVVRFNAPVLSDEYQAYSGKRTDLWVLSPSLARQKPMKDIRAMAVSGINILAGESGYWQHLAQHSADTPVALFKHEHWYSLVARLQAPPTAGLLLLTSLAEQKDICVSAFGFSRVGSQRDHNAGAFNRTATDGSAANHYGDRKPASSRHNWCAEAQLLERWHDSTSY